jgi:hypothetical protein
MKLAVSGDNLSARQLLQWKDKTFLIFHAVKNTPHGNEEILHRREK